jgi:hypothetical protein
MMSYSRARIVNLTVTAGDLINIMLSRAARKLKPQVAFGHENVRTSTYNEVNEAFAPVPHG